MVISRLFSSMEAISVESVKNLLNQLNDVILSRLVYFNHWVHLAHAYLQFFDDMGQQPNTINNVEFEISIIHVT